MKFDGGNKIKPVMMKDTNTITGFTETHTTSQVKHVSTDGKRGTRIPKPTGAITVVWDNDCDYNLYLVSISNLQFHASTK